MAINSLNSSSHGLSGLVSGMDTQSMVDALLMGTQSKIDKQNNRKSVLTMKQEMYHSVITQLKNLQDSFFSYTSKGTNLLSSEFFKAMSGETQSTLFKVNATANANAGKIKVDYIKQLAQANISKSKEKSSGALEGNLSGTDLAKLKDTAKASLTFTVNDGTTDRAFTIDNLNALVAGKGQAEAAKAINDKLVGIGVKVDFDESGAFKFSTNDPSHKITITGNGPGTTLVGSALTGTGSVSRKMDLSSLDPSIEVTYNGVKKRISFDYNANTADDIAKSLEASMVKAFGKVATVTSNNGKITFNTADESSKLSVTGDQGALKALGILAGSSNKIETGMSLKNINFKTPLYGQNQQFTINGVDFNFGSDRSLNTVMSDINNSSAGVKVSYSSTEDKFLIESTVLGVVPDIEMSQTEGNLLTSMFGAENGSNARGTDMFEQNKINGSAMNLPADYKGGPIKIMVNGAEYTFTIPKKKDGDDKELPDTDPNAVYTKQQFTDALNKQLGDQFGKTEGGVANVRMELTGDKLSLTAERGNAVTISDADSATILGIAKGATTTAKASGGSTMAQLGLSGKMNINGTDIEFSSNKTVNQLQSEMNSALGTGHGKAEFEASTGKFRFFGVDIPMSIVDGTSGEQIFGGKEFNPNNATALDVVQVGQNAIAKINGIEIERSSNDFDIDGVQFTLLGTSEFDASGKPIGSAGTAEISRNTEQVFDGIKKFVEEYNKIVDNLYGMITADPTYKKYPPLTAQQKTEMTESDIKLWEERSKEGLLRNDATLQSILGEMRSGLFKKPAGGNLALYDIGINTYYDGYSSNTGKLQISEDELKAALAKDPEEVRKLFTSDDGVANAMLNALNGATAVSGSSPNSLITIAGQAGRFDSSSSIYKEIKDINDNLTRLEKTYKTEYNRYWRQFNAMEQMISNMNSQSSWLSQQLG